MFDCFNDYQIIPTKTSCKHGQGSCEVCGTSDKTDVKHTTEGGYGKVGQLIKKSKRKK